MPDANPTRSYYVYQLIDPRNEQVFYIGKGQRERAWEHEKQVRDGHITRLSNQQKLARIHAIISAGLRVVVAIIEHFTDEQEALAFEAALIRQTPALTNGHVTYLSDAERAQAISLRNALVDLARRKHRNRLLNSLGAFRGEQAKATTEEFINRLPKRWARFVPVTNTRWVKREARERQAKTRYFAPRWVRNQTRVVVTEGEHAGRPGIILHVSRTGFAVIEMAGGSLYSECPISWLKRAPKTQSCGRPARHKPSVVGKSTNTAGPSPRLSAQKVPQRP